MSNSEMTESVYHPSLDDEFKIRKKKIIKRLERNDGNVHKKWSAKVQ